MENRSTLAVMGCLGILVLVVLEFLGIAWLISWLFGISYAKAVVAWLLVHITIMALKK